MAKYTLKAQSVSILRQILSVPGWAKSIDEIYKGGRLLAIVLPEIKNGEPAKEPVTFEMDGPDRDLCKQAVNFGITKEAIPASEWVMDICETLEFVSKPKADKPAETPAS